MPVELPLYFVFALFRFLTASIFLAAILSIPFVAGYSIGVLLRVCS